MEKKKNQWYPSSNERAVEIGAKQGMQKKDAMMEQFRTKGVNQ